MLKYAVESLTVNRSQSCCVKRQYVRDLYDYFINECESKDAIEANTIKTEHIVDWERLHDSCIGHKRPETLNVCYLSGPEPKNDFLELISLGVLPQNIWAFENNNSAYLQALQTFSTGQPIQPKIISSSIEKFFEYTPKTFDIVYIDACGAFVSDKHALRCISSLFKHHRLSSPGMLLTNFCEFNTEQASEKEAYTALIAKYLYYKETPNHCILKDEASYSASFEKLSAEISNYPDHYYGEFITKIICDVASMIVPVSRFMHSSYLRSLTDLDISSVRFDLTTLKDIKHNSICKFLLSNSILNMQGVSDASSDKTQKLYREICSDSKWEKDLDSVFFLLYTLRSNIGCLKKELQNIAKFFDAPDNIYQFLDKPTVNLFFDLIVNQLAYPMHFNAESIKRITYKAKNTKMYMDAMVFDECRYIYDWFPTLHQIKDVFQDKSWQYVFRFALDGLVKQRLLHNNEFFFQSSVISKTKKKFSPKKIKERILISEV